MVEATVKRRSLLLAAGAFPVASALGATARRNVEVKSSAVITVDCLTQVEPLRLSLMGLRANSEEEGLLESLSLLNEIGPNYFCIGIEFDGHLEPAPYSKAVAWKKNPGNPVPVSANNIPKDWLLSVESQLLGMGITPILQCAGAPPQYAQDVAVKPAEHPAPVDMNGYLQWTGKYFIPGRHEEGVLVILNNEPGHSLTDFDITKNSRGEVVLPNETSEQYIVRRRLGRQDAAVIQNQMLGGVSTNLGNNRLGLGSYVSGDFSTGNGRGMPDGVRTFFEGAIDAYTAGAYSSSASLLGFNNYNGRFANDIFGKWQSRNNQLQMPAMFSQIAVGRIKFGDDGLTAMEVAPIALGAACDMLTDTERLLHLPCEAACRNFWTGGDYGFLRINDDGSIQKKIAWYVLWMLSLVPARRLAVTGDDPTAPERQSLGTHVVAGIGGGIIRALVWNDATESRLVKLAPINIPSSYALTSSSTTLLEGSATVPTVTSGVPASFTLLGESVALLEWRTASATDLSARRQPLGASCRAISAPLEVHPSLGGWGKWDIARGTAQLYVLNAASVRATARFSGLPEMVYFTVHLASAPTGRVRIRITFEGGITEPIVNELCSTIVPGTIYSADLASLGGAGWVTAGSRATIDVYVIDASPGTKGNVWVSNTSAGAAASVI